MPVCVCTSSDIIISTLLFASTAYLSTASSHLTDPQHPCTQLSSQQAQGIYSHLVVNQVSTAAHRDSPWSLRPASSSSCLLCSWLVRRAHCQGQLDHSIIQSVRLQMLFPCTEGLSGPSQQTLLQGVRVGLRVYRCCSKLGTPFGQNAQSWLSRTAHFSESNSCKTPPLMRSHACSSHSSYW